MPGRVVRVAPGASAAAGGIPDRTAIRPASGVPIESCVAGGADDGDGDPRPPATPTWHSRRERPTSIMTTPPDRGPRRIKAAIIGIGLDGHDRVKRLTTSDSCVLLGGSADSHAEMLETVLRLESELERIGQPLEEVSPVELAEIAWRIDSPELHRFALRLHDGLQRRGRSFRESSAEELTELSA